MKDKISGISIPLRHIALAAAITFFLLIVVGGTMRVASSGATCTDLPTCYGDWLTQAYAQDSIPRELTHVLIAVISLPFMTTFHMGITLIILALLTVATVTAFHLHWMDNIPLRLTFRSPFAKLSLWGVGLTFALMVSGAWVVSSGGGTICGSLPLCNRSLLPQTPLEWLNMGHRLVALASSGIIVVLFFQAWRTQRRQTLILTAATATGVLFFAQVLMGATKVARGFPPYLVGLHSATATAAWVSVIVLATSTAFAAPRKTQEHDNAETRFWHPGFLQDLLALTKPVVVALLLVTTFAGMVIGAQKLPSLSSTFWALLGGALAAGGSGAINQYIDREDDRKMQRTQKRPIPAGRLTPGEGLAFGVALCLASIFLMVAFVNLLAALLSLAGIIYYVLIYSIILKKTTVQNIVIGGGAGAIPPLVGWAAATGSLNIPSLFLFAVVFMWTPPHFWALALVRRKDYARADVPMLPVVRGERETRRQIFIYSLELVALTLLLPLFGLGGGIYLVSAVVLGGSLLYAAWRVQKKRGNKVAWQMYRLSSMYLAFLFVALMVDRLL